MVRVEHDHLAERSWVDEPQFLRRATGQVQHDMSVIRTRRAIAGDEHAATHAQMDHQCIARVQGTDDVLAAAPDRRHRRPRQSVDQLLTRGAPHRSFATDLHSLDPPADDERDHATANGFDLREFRHDQTPSDNADSESNASDAACCSASFFDFPSPTPRATPSTSTVAVKVLEWSGPVSVNR